MQTQTDTKIEQEIKLNMDNRVEQALAVLEAEVVVEERGDLPRSPQDRDGILNYGTNSEKGVSDFADELLKQVQGRDLGEVGRKLSELRSSATTLNPDKLKKGKNFLVNMFRNAKAEVVAFADRFRNVNVQIESISAKLEDDIIEVRKGNLMLDSLLEISTTYFKELSAAIGSGKALLEKWKLEDLPEAQRRAREANPEDAPQLAQIASDIASGIELFDRKLANMEKSRAIALMQLPTIRNVQRTGELLIEEAKMAIAHAIPAWKTSMLIYIEQMKQAEGIADLNKTTDFTNSMIKGLATANQQNTIDIFKQTSRGIADADAIAESIRTLIDTFDKVGALQQDAIKKREEGRKVLQEAEAALRARQLGETATKKLK